MADLLTSNFEDFLTSRSALEHYDDVCCSPYFLTDRQVVLLLSTFRYAEWESRWEGRDIDAELVARTQEELLTCRNDIVEQLTRLANALYTTEEEPRSIADVIAAIEAQAQNAQDETPFLDVAEDIALVLGVEAENLPEIALDIIPLVLAAA
jgi:hypothetical protein